MLTNKSILLFLSNLLIAVRVRPDISEFRLHQLDEYNELIGCLSTFKEDFVLCNQDIKRLGHTVYNVFPENSTLGKAFKCCGIWMVRDCWYKSATKNCPKSQLLLIHKMPHKLLPFLHLWCEEWTDQSFLCRLPRLWPLFVIVLALIAFFTVIACAICVMRRQRSRTPKKKSEDIESPTDRNNTNIKTTNNNICESESDDETEP